MFAQAEVGKWVVRLRAVDVIPNEDSRLGKRVNLHVAPVMSNGAELILALGSKHDVKVANEPGAVVPNQLLSSVDALPPTLTAQWHFQPDATLDSYVGVGINHTIWLDRHLAIHQGALAGSKIKVNRDGWGPALQAGFDINLKDGWLTNADVKYLWLDTDVKLKNPLASNAWTNIDSLDINPWVVGIAIGKKF